MLAMKDGTDQDATQATVSPVPLRMLQIEDPRHQEVQPEPHRDAGTEDLEGNEKPEPQKGLVDDMKTMVADDRQLGLRMMDAVERPEESIGVLPAMIPVADEIRNH